MSKPAPYQLQSHHDHTTTGDDSDREDEASQSLLNGHEDHPTTYQTSEYIGESEGHLAMLVDQAHERNRFMQTIERDVVQVHSIFLDVNQMVNAQQPMIDDIEQKISYTNDNTRVGMEQLLQAQQYQAAKRKKMCCLFCLMVVAIFLFFLFIWVAFGGN